MNETAFTLCAVIGLAIRLNACQVDAYMTESLDNWVLGNNKPQIIEAAGYDNDTGNVVYIPVGTDGFYYEIAEAGEGGLDFWVYDPGNCLDSTDTGYDDIGPMWGLMTPQFKGICVGINRNNIVRGCLGYSAMVTDRPYDLTWFADGLRGDGGIDWQPGWYRWGAYGTYHDITFTLYDVDYDALSGPGTDLAHGDCIQTYDETSSGGLWEKYFGQGFKGFYLKGDNTNGVEDISVEITSASGAFDYLCGTGVRESYEMTSWGEIKRMFR